MNLQELIKRQQYLLDKAKAENRDLTAEEQKEFDELQTKIEELDKDGQKATNELDNEKQKEIDESNYYSQIVALCKNFDVSLDKLSFYIEKKMSPDEIKDDILNEKTSNNNIVKTTIVKDEKDTQIKAMSESMLARENIEEHTDNKYMGYGIKDLFIECLKKDHVNVETRDANTIYDMATRQWFNPTSMLSALIDSTVNKAIVNGYEQTPTTFETFTKRGTLKDFRESRNEYVLGSAGLLEKVPENGELKHDTWADVARPTRKLETYGRQFTLTRQAFINDDISLVTQMPYKYAASAKRTQNNQVYSILVDNPKIYDNEKLFDTAKHYNLMKTGTDITPEALQNMILALSNQKDDFGEPIYQTPKYIVVPVGLGFKLQTLLLSPTINTTGNTQAVNPLFNYAKNLTVVEDATLNVMSGDKACPWFLIGEEFIQVDYLNGRNKPYIRRSEVAGTLGFVWDVYLDWAISVIDYRGAIRNDGVKLANPLENK